MPKRNRHLLLIHQPSHPLDLLGLWGCLQLQQWFVQLLALSAEEYVEKIVDHPRLSLQEGFLGHVRVVSLLRLLFFVFGVVLLINKRLKHLVVKLHLVSFVLLELVHR
jgi:hypothetical protein